MSKFSKTLLAIALSVILAPSLAAAKTMYDPYTGHYYKVKKIHNFHHYPLHSTHTTTETYHLNRHVSISRQITHLDRPYMHTHGYNVITVADTKHSPRKRRHKRCSCGH